AWLWRRTARFRVRRHQVTTSLAPSCPSVPSGNLTETSTSRHGSAATHFTSRMRVASQAHVAAGRLDTGEVTHLTPTLGMQAVVTAFDVSPDAAFLIQIEELDAERQLVLFHVSGPAIATVDLSLAGNYLTHAFSRDSRWPAFITSNSNG